jgi:hypothetical protein
LRPFTWPSVGRFLRSSPDRPSFFPEARFAAPACHFVLERFDLADAAAIEPPAPMKSGC